ncbi:kinase [Ferrovibrio terrae]|uniref:GHMP family kinase ATP-binding protein n=1 Tax=Ferrovibrio terrae TaxID=2594003 RepID=UPI00313846AE
MIICRTPFRVSFFGGGTDYPTWFQQNGGAVISTTINRYCYLTVRYLPPFFEHKSRIVWGTVETVDNNDHIKHPVVRTALQLMDMHEGVEIHYDGDLPARTGLGSSSSFTVGILHALHAMKGRMIGKEELAKMAIHLEQKKLTENVGVQDQIAAAYGGFNRIDIQTSGEFSVTPLAVRPARLTDLQDRLVLFYTGISRIASEVAGEQIRSIPDRQHEMRAIREMVNEAADILNSNGPLSDFGRLLHEGWMLKRSLADRISSAFIDDIYNKARQAGAVGGKLLGAGGGGFILFYIEPEQRQAVTAALDKFLQVPIAFENSGSQIIFYNPDPYNTGYTEDRFTKILN